MTVARCSGSRVLGRSSFQVQHSNVCHTGSRLTSPFGVQHNPVVLDCLVLKTLQRAGHAQSTILIRLDASSFHPTNTQRPLLELCGRSQSVPIRSIERPMVVSSFVYAQQVWTAAMGRVVGFEMKSQKEMSQSNYAT